MKTVFGLFLISHALIHSSFISKQPTQKPGAPEWPFDLTKSLVFSPLGVSSGLLKIVGIVLSLISLFGFIASGLGWMGVPFLKSIWLPVTVLASISSMLLLFIFWKNWFFVGVLIDLAILYLALVRNFRP